MSGQVHEIDPATLQEMMAQERVTLVDVREGWELAQARLPKAHWNPTSSFDVEKVPREAGKVVVFQCAVGMRSRRAAELFCARYEEDAYNLAGGLNAWEAQGLSVQRSTQGALPLQQKVVVLVGLLILAFAALSLLVSPSFAWALLVLGVHQVLVGYTGFCWMSVILGKLQPQTARA